MTRPRRPSSRRGALALALFGAAACGRAPERAPSALLITLDTTRADALGCYGAPGGLTPELDALAREGVLFERARTVAPLTLPAHASMLTGLVPPRHTVIDNSLLALPGSARTIAERARASGRRTAAFVSAVVLASEYGLDQGFELYDEPPPQPEANELVYEHRPAREIAAAAVAWIEGLAPDEPFLAWAHFFDPHAPYEPAPEDLARAGGDAYRAELGEVDRAVGRILAALRAAGRFDDTVIVVAGDHGESLGEHGETTHGVLCYEGTARVPLLVKPPRGAGARTPGERSREVASVVDVEATLAAALGLPALEGADGRSLLAPLPADRAVYVEARHGYEAFGWSPLAGVADARGKYLHSARPEFYAADDTEERDDLWPSLPEAERARYRAEIARYASAPALERAPEDRIDERGLDALAKLGYAGAAAASEVERLDPLAPTDRPAPADSMRAHRDFLAAEELCVAGRTREAIALLEPLIAAHPRNHTALVLYGGALIAEQRYADAVWALEAALREGREWSAPHRNLGICFERLGDPARAIGHYARAVELAPERKDVVLRVVELLRAEGREQEAARYLELLIE